MPEVLHLIRQKVEAELGLPKNDTLHLLEWEKKQGYNPFGYTLVCVNLNSQIRNSSIVIKEFFQRIRKDGD